VRAERIGLATLYHGFCEDVLPTILRHLLEKKYDPAAWDEKANWQRDRRLIEEYGFANRVIKKLGLSGAQWSAATMALVRLGELMASLKMTAMEMQAHEEASIKAIADAEYESWSFAALDGKSK